MQRHQASAPDATVYVENIGGIHQTSVSFEPGVTILVGRNTTNRTSFLQAVMAGLGSTNVTMKGDADHAEVKLELGDKTYSQVFSREEGKVKPHGDPYLDDPKLADLFAFLLESNEARRAVATNGDLRELIMRPVDTEEIQSEITRLQDRRESLRADLETIDDQKGSLRRLEDRQDSLKAEIEDTKAQLEETEAELNAADTDLETRREEQSELEDRLAELREKRAEVDDVRYKLETEQESLQELRTERREAEENLKTLGKPETDVGEINSRLSDLRERKAELETQVNELQSLIQFNENMLDGEGEVARPTDLGAETEGELTAQLLNDKITCWTCGSAVDPDQIESTVEQLRERSRSKVGEVDQLEHEIEELQSEKREIKQARRDRERIEQRLNELDTEIQTTEEAIDDLRSRRERLTGEIERIEDTIDELENDAYDTVLDLHKTANKLEYELGRLESDLEDVENEITEAEARISKEGEIEAELDSVNEQIERQRSRIERIERESVEEFNEHMESILDRLDYENIERIWIERQVRTERHNESISVFELHVIRTTDSGAAYEDTIHHLSESEREVTGLVFALAGYLVHEVYETVPFMLLDSLEAIDSERIAALINYFSAYSQYVLAALLPEDASALDDSYTRITDI